MRPLVYTMLFGASLALAGCSSGGGDGVDNTPPPAPPPPPPAAIPPVSTSIIDVEDGHRVGMEHWAPGNASTGGQGQPMGPMQCLGSQPVAFHVHTHLSMFLNGEQLAIPTALGFVGTGTPNACHYPLHTHDWTGMIHVHASAPTTFTLGQVFQIWGQPLSSTDVAGLTGMPVRVFVNEDGAAATEVTGESNWANIELTSRRHFTIQVGTDFTEIPKYTWVGP
jgi:hypothetical protein